MIKSFLIEIIVMFLATVGAVFIAVPLALLGVMMIKKVMLCFVKMYKMSKKIIEGEMTTNFNKEGSKRKSSEDCKTYGDWDIDDVTWYKLKELKKIIKGGADNER